MWDSLTLLFFSIIILMSAFIHGLMGLGFPMVATPLFTLFTDVRSAVILLLFPTLLLNIINIVLGGNWKDSIYKHWPLALYGIIGSVIGTKLLIILNPEPFKLLLALVIIFYLNMDRLGLNLNSLSNRPQLSYLFFGLLAGILGGTVNVMVPALIVFGLEMKLSKKSMVQVFNFCFLTGKLSQGIILAINGYITLTMIETAVPLVIIALSALFTGIYLAKKVPAEKYKGWLRVILWIISILLLFQFIKYLFNL